MYKLYIIDEDGDQRFSLQSEKKEYLIDRGEEWVRLNFIRSYYIVESE